MKVQATLFVLFIACVQIYAKDSRLSNDCLTGARNAADCCAEVPDAFYAHLRNPANCETFFHCDHGAPVLKDCPASLHWSVASDKCDWPENAQCTTGDSSSTTAPTAAPTDAPTTVPTAAPTGTPTSAPTDCNVPDGCRSGSISAAECCAKYSGLHCNLHLPHELDCGLFYQCEHGKPTLKTCASPLHFNPILEVCDWADKAGCETAKPDPTTAAPDPTTAKPDPTTTSPPITTPPAPAPAPKCHIDICDQCLSGLFPAGECCNHAHDYEKIRLVNAHDSTKYYQCIGNAAVSINCPGDLHFSKKTDRCEHP